MQAEGAPAEPGKMDASLAGEELADAGVDSPQQQQQAQELENDIVGFIPRYQMPNISSLLPSYTNSEQDFIFRTFHTGNYDYIKHLPEDIKFHQVQASRTQRMEATRQFLMPTLGQPLLKSNPNNQQGLFSTFEYITSRFSLADELASKERVESEAKRFAIGGKEFTPAGMAAPGKHEDFEPGKLFPYLGGPQEATEDARQAHRILEDAKRLPAPFVAPGTDKLIGEKPTRAVAWEMMTCVRKWIMQDWEGAEVSIFENHADCWVVRIGIASIDSLDGMLAYMNVFVRCNELVNAYRLTKVVEFWHTQPDDGAVYYVLRPPWVRPDTIQTFYTLHPEEQHWSTSHAVQEVQRTRRGGRGEGDGDDLSDAGYPGGGGGAGSALSYVSRLEWGKNFLTGTPASATLGKIIPGDPR